MGYNLSIGQAIVKWNEDCVGIAAESVRIDSAPAFGEFTDYTNSRSPVVSAWGDFCEALGIKELMFGATRNKWEFTWDEETMPVLLSEHPGCAPLLPTHLKFIKLRLEEYKAKHPDHIAQYPPLREGVEDYVDDPIYDGTLCRAEWLVFWVEWALEHCDKPVFVNT